MAYFSLQPYAGKQSRHTCPQCGRRYCFTYYVDEFGNPLDETVGRCDHESGCGYHYTPKEFFADHPDRVKDTSAEDEALRRQLREQLRRKQERPVDTIPFDIVGRSVRLDYDSDLIAYLRSVFGDESIDYAIGEYYIGVTKARDTIFFEVDKDHKVRTGKVMKYDRKTGHRIKDETVGGRITWVHTLMKRNGQLSEEWAVTQSLFGEHLITRRPEAEIHIVESEKTAIICAAVMRQYIWIATGGKSYLDDRRLQVLKGRRIVLYPDVDAFAKWTDRAKELRAQGFDVTVSDYIERNATERDREDKIDLADVLIRSHLRQTRSARREYLREHPIIDTSVPKAQPSQPQRENGIDAATVAAIREAVSRQYYGEVVDLVRDCGLYVVSAGRRNYFSV